MGTLPKHLRDNPLFDVNEKFHYMPSWDKIELSHFMPAFDYALEQARQNVQAIKDNQARPSFKNTAEALDASDDLLGHIFLVFYNYLPNAKEEDEHSRLEEEMSAKYAAFYNETFTDKTLFARFESLDDRVYKQKHSSEKIDLFEMYYNTFIGAGINYTPEKQKRLAKIDERMAELEIEIHRNMRKAQNEAVIVTDEDELEGLSDDMIAEAAQRAEENGHKGSWALTLQEMPYMAAITNAEDRGLRERLWRAYHARGSQGQYDNRDLIKELVTLRHRHAKMTGARSFAHDTLQYNAAKTPQNVGKFLRTLKNKAMPHAKKELKILGDYAREEDGVEEFKPWDLHYYAQQYKAETIGLDEEALRPYFELNNVVQGNLDHLSKLFGVTFTESEEYPVYDDEIRVFEVTNARSGKHLGVIMMDLLARDDKGTGIAWDMRIVPQGLYEGENRRPIDVVVTKFPKGQNGKPTLLTHYDVLTLFHELGHAMHNMLSQTRYQSFSGYEIQHDYVEFPSQIQENWAYEAEVLDSFARHYETGEPIPDDLKAKLKQSRKFMVASTEVVERAAKGWLDIQWAKANPKDIESVEEFEKKALKGFRLFPEEPGQITTHFSYIFGGGYDAGFYGYQYSAQSEADWYEFFQRKGLYDKDAARRTKEFMEKGGTESGATLFRKMRHRNPKPDGLLRRFGFLKDTFNDSADLPEPSSSFEDEQYKVRPFHIKRWCKRSLKL